MAIWCDEIPEDLSPLPEVRKAKNWTRDDGQVPLEDTVTKVDDDIVSDEDIEIDDGPPTLWTWRKQMLSEPAAEVRAVVGGIVLVFPMTSYVSTPGSPNGVPGVYLEMVKAVNDLREKIEEEGYARDAGETAAVVLLVKAGKDIASRELAAATEKMEEMIMEGGDILGWDVVGWDGTSGSGDPGEGATSVRNAYGEKVGIERVKEILENIDWSVSVPLSRRKYEYGDELHLQPSDDEEGIFEDFGTDGIKLQGQELEREMMGLKLAMKDHGLSDDAGEEDLKIDQLPQLLDRVVAIKEAGLEMSKSDREKYAKREVERMMREMA